MTTPLITNPSTTLRIAFLLWARIWNIMSDAVPFGACPSPNADGYPKTNLLAGIGCFGSTRLPGAGAIVRKDGALFGPPKSDVPGPASEKKSPKAATKSSEPFRYEDTRKATVPAKDEKPIMGIRTNKNFVVANAVEAILQGENSPTGAGQSNPLQSGYFCGSLC
jgi:hypothetical protein